MDDLKHYGMPRRSGRFPWGSGEMPFQRGADYLSYIRDLKRKGMTDVEIAKLTGISTTQLRARRSIAKADKRSEDVAMVIRLKDKGYSNVAIGRRMGLNESSVRTLLDPVLQARSEITKNTADILKKCISEKPYLDVGLGVESQLGITRNKLKTAIEMLKEEGYKIHYIQVEQLGTGKNTNVMVLTDPSKEWTEVNKNKDQIKLPIEYRSSDRGRTYDPKKPIQNIDSSEVLIRYGDEGGSDKDGVIELRRGVEHLSLGNANYAQVRIGVDGTHFLKGMAVYSDGIPDGKNIIYNTNKKIGTPPEKVFKPNSLDPENPFGASVKAGGQRGALNIVNEEGDWNEWSKNLSSQMLSKQNPPLIKQQLDLTLKIKKEELEVINSLNNPAIKKRLLDSYADDLDAAAVHLKAAALPRQNTHVLLPFPDMKENQIYAPQYRNGEQVVLIRHPHGGTFEIPQLTVNNNQKDIRKVIGRAKDAVGIHPKVAERLSGADFDGDAVIVIPTNGKTIKTTKRLIQDFDTRESYPGHEGLPKMKPETTQRQMGDISNLITDMSLKGANESELARAVRHSMVVIDAEKHGLDYKKSAIDHGIAALKKKYQGSEKGGASTLVSRASSEKRVDERTDYFKVDPKTGKKIYEYTGATYTNKAGKIVKKTTKSTKMAEVDDARLLSSGTIKENIYADYANKVKAMANDVRKTSLTLKSIEYSPSARKTYSKEVDSLNSKLNLALRNAPLERQAQLLGNKAVAVRKSHLIEPDYKTLQKIRGQEIVKARNVVGASKQRVDITPIEWEAIQAGAVSSNILKQILNNTDLDRIKEYATPRATSKLSLGKIAKAKAMSTSGYTQAEIADSIGVSISVIAKALE